MVSAIGVKAVIGVASEIGTKNPNRKKAAACARSLIGINAITKNLVIKRVRVRVERKIDKDGKGRKR